MSFVQSFEKRAEGMRIVENDRSDVTSRSLDDSSKSVHSGGRKSQLVRGRTKTNRQTGRSASGQATGQWSQEKEFIPERMSHYKRWENSRSQSGGTPSVYDQF